MMGYSSSEDSEGPEFLADLGTQTSYALNGRALGTARSRSVQVYRTAAEAAGGGCGRRGGRGGRPPISTCSETSNYTFRDCSATESSENRRWSNATLTSSLLSGTEDTSFLAITGICTSSSGPRTSGSSAPPTPRPAPLARPRVPRPRSSFPPRTVASSRTLASARPQIRCIIHPTFGPSPSAVDATSSQAVGTQSDLTGHVPRHVFEGKVKSIFPERGRPPITSNVFILLSDGTGQTVFAVTTRTAKKSRQMRLASGDIVQKATLRRPPVLAVATADQEMPPRENKMKKRNVKLVTDTVNGAVDLNESVLMLNVSTQTSLTRLSFKRVRKLSSAQQNTCAFCMEKYDRDRQLEISNKLSDSIIFHYRAARGKFDSNLESESAVRALGQIERTESETTSNCTDDCTFNCNKPRTLTQLRESSSIEPVIENSTHCCEDDFAAGSEHLFYTFSETKVGKKKTSEKSTVVITVIKNRQKVRKATQHSNNTERKKNKLITEYARNDDVLFNVIPTIPHKTKTEKKTSIVINNNCPLDKASSNVNIDIGRDKETYSISIQYSDSRRENLTIHTLSNKKDNFQKPLPSNATTERNREENIDQQDIENLRNKEIKTMEAGTSRSSIVREVRDNEMGTEKMTTDDTSESTQSDSTATSNTGNSSSSHATVMAPVGAAAERWRQPAVTAVVAGHYRGDDCLLQDPLDRDREIRRLLGVERRYRPALSKSQPSWPSTVAGSHCACGCLRVSAREPEDKMASDAVDPRQFYGERNIMRKSRKKSSSSSGRIERETGEPRVLVNKELNCELGCEISCRENMPHTHNSMPQCSISAGTAEPNIPAGFSVGRDARKCKHRPIRISQSEYLMIKTSLHRNLPRTETDHRIIKKSKVFVRENNFRNSRKSTTPVMFIESNRGKNSSQKPYQLKCKSFLNIIGNTTLYHLNVATQTFADSGGDLRTRTAPLCSLCRFDLIKKNIIMCNTDCTVLTVQRNRRNKHRNGSLSLRRPCPQIRRNAMSSVELSRSKTIMYRPVSHSLCNILGAQGETMTLRNKFTSSVLTLFKGKKEKEYSPNLGTSTITLCRQHAICDSKFGVVGAKALPKPSLFKRLFRFMSKKKSKDAACQVAGDHVMWDALVHVATPDTSFDSYHINSSFEEIELSSSIYDTSMSNFSQHTTVPFATTHRKNKSVAKKIKNYLKKS